MEKMLYLTEDDIKLQEEHKKKDKVKNQKQKLQRLLNLQAKAIHSELHSKTHFKAATQMLYSNFQPNTTNES